MTSPSGTGTRHAQCCPARARLVHRQPLESRAGGLSDHGPSDRIRHSTRLAEQRAASRAPGAGTPRRGSIDSGPAGRGRGARHDRLPESRADARGTPAWSRTAPGLQRHQRTAGLASPRTTGRPGSRRRSSVSIAGERSSPMMTRPSSSSPGEGSVPKPTSRRVSVRETSRSSVEQCSLGHRPGVRAGSRTRSRSWRRPLEGPPALRHQTATGQALHRDRHDHVPGRRGPLEGLASAANTVPASPVTIVLIGPICGATPSPPVPPHCVDGGRESLLPQGIDRDLRADRHVPSRCGRFPAHNLTGLRGRVLDGPAFPGGAVCGRRLDESCSSESTAWRPPDRSTVRELFGVEPLVRQPDERPDQPRALGKPFGEQPFPRRRRDPGFAAPSSTWPVWIFSWSMSLGPASDNRRPACTRATRAARAPPRVPRAARRSSSSSPSSSSRIAPRTVAAIPMSSMRCGEFARRCAQACAVAGGRSRASRRRGAGLGGGGLEGLDHTRQEPRVRAGTDGQRAR